MTNTLFVTPYDREDLVTLAFAVDDVADAAENAAELLGLYGVETADEAVVRALRAARPGGRASSRTLLGGAEGPARLVRRDPRDQGDRGRGRRRRARRAREPLQGRPHRPVIVIRWKDIYEALEDAVDACETAAISSATSSSRTRERYGARCARRRRARSARAPSPTPRTYSLWSTTPGSSGVHSFVSSAPVAEEPDHLEMVLRLPREALLPARLADVRVRRHIDACMRALYAGPPRAVGAHPPMRSSSAVSSPKYQTLPALSWLYQSLVRSARRPAGRAGRRRRRAARP